MLTYTTELDNSVQADLLYDEIRVLCVVYIGKVQKVNDHNNYIVDIINRTWTSKCNGVRTAAHSVAHARCIYRIGVQCIYIYIRVYIYTNIFIYMWVFEM